MTRHLRRRLLGVTAHDALLVEIVVKTKRGSEIQSAINNLGDPQSKEDSVAQLLELINSNGLKGIENFFVKATPVAKVVSVDAPFEPIPIPSVPTPTTPGKPMISIDESQVLAGMPEAAAAASGTGSSTGGTGAAGAPAYHGVASGTNAYMESGGKPTISGGSGHWHYILRSHGSKSHTDPASLALYGLHSEKLRSQ